MNGACNRLTVFPALSSCGDALFFVGGRRRRRSLINASAGMPFNWNDLQFWWKTDAKIANVSSTAKTPAAAKASTSAAAANEPTPPDYLDCPVERDVLGRHSWTLLHTMAANVPDKPTRHEQKELSQFVTTLSNFYPCQFCADEFKNHLKADPPKVGTRQDFAQWMCRLHNSVNERLGKPAFDCSKVDERWRDGWQDGRCD